MYCGIETLKPNWFSIDTMYYLVTSCDFCWWNIFLIYFVRDYDLINAIQKTKKYSFYWSHQTKHIFCCRRWLLPQHKSSHFKESPFMIIVCSIYLTPLTWLIQTLFLLSNWNLDKNFALTGELGQVHVSKKIFLIFILAGRWLFSLLNL